MLVVAAAEGVRALLDAGIAAAGLAHEHAPDVDQALEMSLDAGFEVVLLVVPKVVLPDAAALFRFSGFGGALIALVTDAPAGADVHCPEGVDRVAALSVGLAALPELVAGRFEPAGHGASNSDEFADLPGYAELCDQYAKGLPDTFARMARLACNDDIVGLRRELHTLKGDAGMFGRPAVSRQAQLALALFRADRRADALEACDRMFRQFHSPDGLVSMGAAA